MSCKNFEATLIEVAREQMLDAAVREGALRHVEECAACAACLATERRLTGGLRALSASSELTQAPVHVEANLLARFREQHRRVEQTPAIAPVVVEMQPRRVSRWSEWRTQAVAAAVLLMFAIGGVVALRTRQEGAPASAEPHVVAGKASPNAPTLASSATPETAIEAVENPTVGIVPEKGESGGGQKLSQREADLLLNRTPRRNNVASVPGSKVNQRALQQTSSEIMTDFMPVNYGDNLNSIDSGRIVRVEMPRSALAQFGLPVNMEHANERVKADVLIGDDGMARAIRFVR